MYDYFAHGFHINSVIRHLKAKILSDGGLWNHCSRCILIKSSLYFNLNLHSMIHTVQVASIVFLYADLVINDTMKVTVLIV